jgi:hypothetical protein
MSENKTYTTEEVSAMLSAQRDRQETIEALECARMIMIDQKQYPRFIQRIDHILRSIDGAPTPTHPVKVEEPAETPVEQISITQKRKY